MKAKLNVDAVKKIEKMINPSITAHDSDSTMSDKRFFLYEVHVCIYILVVVTMMALLNNTIILADSGQ